MYTKEPMRLKRGFMNVENKTWENLTEEDNNFKA